MTTRTEANNYDHYHRNSQATNPPREETKPYDRSLRITAVAWLAGITAVVALVNLGDAASIGTGLGVIGISGMVAFVSYTILKS